MEKMKRNKWNKKGAVNTYRFIAIYVLIGILVGAITAFTHDTTDVQKGYDLNQENRLAEIQNRTEQIYDDSRTLVSSNQYALNSPFGDEKSLGGNIWEILGRGFLPTGVIPVGQDSTEMEQSVNWMIIIFRWIIMIFAGYEVFQITIKPKTT